MSIPVSKEKSYCHNLRLQLTSHHHNHPKNPSPLKNMRLIVIIYVNKKNINVS